jgi:hypothetical protein
MMGQLMLAAKLAIEAKAQPFLLHIDEINRADLSKVLGEAVMLLEYNEESRSIKLPYDFGPPFHNIFFLPSNLHILSPAVAALSAYGVVAVVSIIFRQSNQRALRVAAAALIIVAVGLWGARRSRLHSSYAKQSYQLGLALKSVSQPDDLVVTLGDTIGCPVAIYYSDRRGWLFPPYEEIKDWETLPKDDEAIATFERLRARGADWFGVVNNRRDDIWEARPRFAKHIEQTCELKEANESGIIYRIPARTR